MLRGINGSGGGVPTSGSGAAGYLAKWTAATTLGGSTTTGATASPYVDATGNVGVATASPGTKLDVAYGDYLTTGAMRIGADVGTNTSRTDATGKVGAISMPHFTNASANAFLIGSYANTASTTLMYIGGGLGNMNASTRVSIYAGATSTTSPGTEIVAATTAGLSLGSTATLVFNAAVSGQGIKLATGPTNTDPNTLDSYFEAPAAATAGNGWTPTLSAAGTWGGVTPVVTYARYVRVGSIIFVHVQLTGAALTVSAFAGATISMPTGIAINAYANQAVVTTNNDNGASGTGVAGAGNIYSPAFAACTRVTYQFFYFTT